MRANLQMKAMNREEAEKFARNPANRAIVAMVSLFLLSFLFYFLSAFFGYLGGSGAAAPKTIMTEDGEVNTDVNAADSFQKVQLSMRIMPTHKTEGNMLIMLPKAGEAEWAGDYDADFSE